MPVDNIAYVVDSDPSVGEALSTLLATYHIDVKVFPDAETFLQASPLEKIGRGCLMAAVNLRGLSGLSLLRHLRARGFGQPVILLTDTFSDAIRRQALEFGATEVIEKPLINAFLMGRLSELFPDSSARTGISNPGIKLRDGTPVTFRVIRPEDAGIEQEFVRGLSSLSKHMRFFSGMKQLSPSLLEKFTNPSFPESYAIIATVNYNGREREIGVARYMPTTVENVAEFAVVVADDWQGLGVASQLLHGLIVAAALAGITRLEAVVLRENYRMLRLARTFGFIQASDDHDPTVIRVTKEIRSTCEPELAHRSLTA